jgi:hypothetical protein
VTLALAHRVSRRFVARDFPSDKALEKYLHDHPQADKAKHQVVEHDDHGKKDEGHGDNSHDDHDGGSMFSRLKGALKSVASKLKDAPKDVQKFVADPEHRKKALTKGVEAMKKAPKKYVQQLAKVAKHEVHEFKTAGQGLKAVISGKKPSDAQKKAIKAVGIHMGITIAAAVLTTASPALATMAVGKAMGKHMALKAVTAALADLHVLEEWGHIGHGVQHVLQNLKFAEEKGDDEKASPEELLAALIMKHIGEQMKDVDDDTLAEAMGGDDEDEDAEGQQKQSARRVATRYLSAGSTTTKVLKAYLTKTARPMMSPWEGEDHQWPAVDESVWEPGYVTRDRFNDVHVLEYIAFGLAATPSVTVDTRPWIHDKKRHFDFKIKIFGKEEKSGKIKVDDYEREIPKVLDEALRLGEKETAAHAKQLDQLKVPHWEINYDKRGDDLTVEYKAPDHSPYSDSSLGGTFYSPLAIFTGGKADYDISYSEGGDYEGSFGVRERKGEVRSIADIKQVLRDAEKLWERAEKDRVRETS